MTGEIHTNIVPIDPSNQPEQNIEEYSQKLAQDAISFLQEEFKDDINDRFWEIVRDGAIAKLSHLDKVSEVMSPEECKLFLQEKMPWGKYADQKVQTVLKKDPEGLNRFATRPLPFQLRLQRFLNSQLDKSPSDG